MKSNTQRTDQAERILEQLASVPLTWENVFRSPSYRKKSDKEVVDLLLVLRNKGIFVSMKCQQDPDKRTGSKLVKWAQKSANSALQQLRGGIRTSKKRQYWCCHPRRGRVNFEPNQIDPIHAVVIVETYEQIVLSEEAPIAIESIPVSYLSVNDFLNLVVELRTINDLSQYLTARRSICVELQRTIGIEQIAMEFYHLHEGSPPAVEKMRDVIEITNEQEAEIRELVNGKKTADRQARIIEQLSNNLSERMEQHGEGLDEGIANLFDPSAKRSNYLLMQDELCDLVLDERRKLGASMTGAINRVIADDSEKSICFQAAHLDSKPDFLYILSSSRGYERNELLEQCLELIQGGLAYYGKSRGLLVNYMQDRDGFEVVLINCLQKSESFVQLGEKYFGHLRMFEIPIEKM